MGNCLWFLLFFGGCLWGIEGEDAEVRANVEAVVSRKYPKVDLGSAKAFYQDNAPDLLEELERRIRETPDQAQEYMELLVKHFVSIDRLRESRPEQYEHLVAQQRMEAQIRKLSRQIQSFPPDANQENQEKCQKLKQELREVLEKAFDEAQLRQEVEINRLENEVRNLRSLAEERAANKQVLLEQRFLLLTGRKAE